MASDGASGEVRYGVARVEDDATARPSATAATAFAPPRGARVFPIPHHHHASSGSHYTPACAGRRELEKSEDRA
uniref:Uncharacterized protein n=1 Tax=Oryza glumipatula TaxID=40148 RepID=A0A0D9YBG8_9ORYZ